MKQKTIKISITTEDGELLDMFLVTDFRNEVAPGVGDYEYVGSSLSNQLLAQRIQQNVLLRGQKGKN